METSGGGTGHILFLSLGYGYMVAHFVAAHFCFVNGMYVIQHNQNVY